MIGQFIGNGIGIGLIAIAVILMRHTMPKGGGGGKAGGGKAGGGGSKPSGWVNKIGSRVVMVLMFLGGTALVVTGIGDLIHGGVLLLFGVLGITGTIIGAVLFIGLLAEAGFKFFRGPTRFAAWCAMLLALAATLPIAGQPAAIANSLNSAGTQWAASISSSLGL